MDLLYKFCLFYILFFKSIFMRFNFIMKHIDGIMLFFRNSLVLLISLLVNINSKFKFFKFIIFINSLMKLGYLFLKGIDLSL